MVGGGTKALAAFPFMFGTRNGIDLERCKSGRTMKGTSPQTVYVLKQSRLKILEKPNKMWQQCRKHLFTLAGGAYGKSQYQSVVLYCILPTASHNGKHGAVMLSALKKES